MRPHPPRSAGSRREPVIGANRSSARVAPDFDGNGRRGGPARGGEQQKDEGGRGDKDHDVLLVVSLARSPASSSGRRAKNAALPKIRARG
jgi:hypothetical protein